MEGKDVDYQTFKELASKDLTEEMLSIVYTGLHSLLRCALRLPLTSLKPEVNFQLRCFGDKTRLCLRFISLFFWLFPDPIGNSLKQF